MSDYKIKLEDKAAFLEKLGKYKVPANSFDFKDNKIENYFEFKTNNPQADEIVKTILKQSPKINKINEMKSKLTKSQLAEIIREELAAAGREGKEKKQMQNEALFGLTTDQIQNILAGVFGLSISIIPIAINVIKALKDAKSPEEAKEILRQAGEGVSRSAGGGGE